MRSTAPRLLRAPRRPDALRSRTGRIITALLAVCLVTTMVVVAPTVAPATVAASAFSDVSSDPASPVYSEFAGEIDWLDRTGVSTGWEVDGRREYRPWLAISRDAMAAFLYRYAGSPDFPAPKVSPFADVATDAPFYREIAWLAQQKVSTGWETSDGAREFRPFESITRDAMAAFLYRFTGVPASTPVPPSPFADVPDGSPFSREISWLYGRGITGGYDAPAGASDFRPWNSITRDAMAAFLSRHANGGLSRFTHAPVPTIDGDARVGTELRATVTEPWSPAPTRVETQWLRDGMPIPGATTSTYTVTRGDAGASLTVRITATLDGYFRTGRQSAVAVVPDDYGSSLANGSSLPAGKSLRSPNRAYWFDVGTDGNLTVSGPGGRVWESRTRGNDTAELRLATDGILHLVRPDGSEIWASTPATAANTRLELRDDGELAVVRGDGRVMWSSRVQGARVWGLPFATGQRWSAGAAHGDGRGAWNALDFGPISGQSREVRTIADGVVGWVACGSSGYLSVDHGDGWTSSYYHLVNVQKGLIGTRVPQGTYLGDVGREVPCGGGATFDHVHLRLFYQDRPVAMNGVTFGGYTAYSSGTAYSGWWTDGNGRRVLTANGGAACCLTAP
ncbi:MAG: hypothetical protein BGO45_00735 [Microbacterium sp. 71-36]|uniref:S-layer homology domain-containing protein n=1 Tax=unclassified Microbacterium TaxID=2609290 RepID=UPI000926EAB0|nr:MULTISPECIES: S-layer homology domain-containing protein [unclassified Microbacterium]MBN9210064.1 S-layer homology domain-containing protein [Microbacterium sp.]OJV76127.1 MAG: hypothetical protein BGO45_00735 [Microbacterium sp. 71-36]